MEVGCDVICEKPLTTDEDKAGEILDAMRRTGRSLRVTFNYRYTPHSTKVRELMMQNGKTNAQGLVDMLPGDSEPWVNVASRALRSISGWLDRHPDDEILFVCHDAVMQSMAQRLTGGFFTNGHGRPFRFTLTDDAWTVVEVGT